MNARRPTINWDLHPEFDSDYDPTDEDADIYRTTPARPGIPLDLEKVERVRDESS